MKKTLKAQQSGFTIIEVVLVLAIAGLIFLVVFLALPQLQKSQRDSSRRSDVGRLVAAATSYVTNNSGNVPSNVGGATPDVSTVVTQGYVEADFAEKYDLAVVPSTYPADLVVNANGREDMYYAKGGSCTADGQVSDSGGTNRSFAVGVVLESGGYYCAEG